MPRWHHPHKLIIIKSSIQYRYVTNITHRYIIDCSDNLAEVTAQQHSKSGFICRLISVKRFLKYTQSQIMRVVSPVVYEIIEILHVFKCKNNISLYYHISTTGLRHVICSAVNICCQTDPLFKIAICSLYNIKNNCH